MGFRFACSSDQPISQFSLVVESIDAFLRLPFSCVCVCVCGFPSPFESATASGFRFLRHDASRLKVVLSLPD